MKQAMKIVAFAGGVGGAKLVDGLAQCLEPSELTVIVNTGDDFEHFGLSISPDLDTVCYTLANLANPDSGWGRKNETWRTLEEVRTLQGPDWFNIGDLDLATHLERTRLLQEGQKLSEITAHFCESWHVKIPVFPMSDTPVRTFVLCKDGRSLPFQEYFVKYHFEPEIRSIEFENIEKAVVPEKALQAIQAADFIIFCPSNPFVSIDPIIKIKEIGESIAKKKVIAISPLIGGEALKGPAAKMARELGMTSCSSEVASHYKNILSCFILDKKDEDQIALVEGWGIMCKALDIAMPDRSERKRLADQILKILEGNF
ncbi:MAG: 2-phospho-L-lactate transferase [Anaerolineaceae bacterium]